MDGLIYSQRVSVPWGEDPCGIEVCIICQLVNGGGGSEGAMGGAGGAGGKLPHADLAEPQTSGATSKASECGTAVSPSGEG